jgi:inosine/xanthosine triphosphate pyrophosphatase family protein
VRNEEELQRIKEVRNILQSVKRRNANWIGHILLMNSLLKHVIEGKTEGRIAVTGRRV